MIYLNVNMKIKVTLSNGKQIDAFPPGELHSADTSKEICFFFDTGQAYFGFLRDIDEYDNVYITRPDAKFDLGLTFSRLLFWFYKEV